jgi:hypothetical protein
LFVDFASVFLQVFFLPAATASGLCSKSRGLPVTSSAALCVVYCVGAGAGAERREGGFCTGSPHAVSREAIPGKKRASPALRTTGVGRRGGEARRARRAPQRSPGNGVG